MADHLVIPDAHVEPDTDNSRFDYLGRFILDRQPPVIICLGDFTSMDSLSSYDKGKKSFEGRRYAKDLAATKDALERLWKPVSDYNVQRKRFKERQYKPKLYMTLGNHEDRIHRAVEAQPELEGMIYIGQLGYEEFGFEVVPYTFPIEIDGVMYCHHFPSGILGRAISSKNMARQLIITNHKSSTVGHSHRLDIANESRADGKRIWGLSAGCFTDHTPPFAGSTGKYWWRGVIYKKGVVDGDYTLETYTIDELRERYAA